MTREQQLREQLNQEQERNRKLYQESRAYKLGAEKALRSLRKELEPLQQAEAERRLRADELRVAQTGGTKIAAYNITTKPQTNGPGVPTLILSDLHVNESIDPRQVLSVNAFGPEIAAKRLKTVITTAIDLGLNHMVKPSRDGMVVPVLGDLVDLLGGFIHAGERQSQPVGLDACAVVADLLQPAFLALADAFGGVLSYWVDGNHGRMTHRMPVTDRNALNLDNAIFMILEGRLRGDKRIRMEHAGGPRMIYAVCGHKFLILHGDRESGMPMAGDSEAGAANTVARGIKRLRSLHLQINRPFDTALVGHYHYPMELPGVIVNGSLPGYGEFAFSRVCSLVPAMQTLFYVHPKYGVTCRWPILAAKSEKS